MKLESDKRGIEFVDPVSEEENPDAEDSTHEDPFRSSKYGTGTHFRPREKHEKKLRQKIISD